ncbi:MAG: hydrogenase maturation protease [Candidatus Thermoplasmatota archaeon]|nr:hydrogenase maturation protease [Candidatus Thermoplasmatota archaeon]
MKTIVLGIGNLILRDDGVGIHVANEVKKQINNPDVTVDEAITGGMNLLDLLLGYDKAILIDAVKSDDGAHGEVRRIPIKEFSTMHSCNPHDVSLIEAIDMAKKLGESRIPKEIIIIGVMMRKIPCEFGEDLSDKIAAAVPEAVKLTLNEIKKDMKISS